MRIEAEKPFLEPEGRRQICLVLYDMQLGNTTAQVRG